MDCMRVSCVRIVTWEATYDTVGDAGVERPKWVVARVVMVSLRRRLIERSDWLSARLRDRKELPASRLREGIMVRKRASASDVEVVGS